MPEKNTGCERPYRLVDQAVAGGCAAKMAPADLERLLRGLPGDPWASRLLTGGRENEDAAVLAVPPGKALAQTIDFLTPIVNDPYKFGQIAAANAFSDIYAMGGEPWCAMNVVCFPARRGRLEVLKEILRGGADKTAEAGAALAGGHSVEDSEIKYGLSVTGLVDPHSFARNSGLAAGLALISTKALGIGVLATAIKAGWEESAELEEIIHESASRLNKVPGELIREFGLKAATDITGFGLGGHLLEMLEASGTAARLRASSLHILPRALDLAEQGLLSSVSRANRKYRQADCLAESAVPEVLIDLVFDAQTSGGLVLPVPPKRVGEALAFLRERGELAAVIGETVVHVPGEPRLRILA